MRALGLALGWALVAAIIWLSVTPQPIDVGIHEGDKLAHMAAYGWLMFWFCQLYRHIGTRAAYAAGFIAMGVALEFVQRTLGYRSFEMLDMLADATGVMLGWGVALLTAPLLRSR